MERIRATKIVALFIVSTVVLFSFCVISYAQLTNTDLPEREGVKLGKVIAHSAFQTEEQLDTNIFLVNTDRKFDAITVLSPSVGVELPVGKNDISADYEADIFL